MTLCYIFIFLCHCTLSVVFVQRCLYGILLAGNGILSVAPALRSRLEYLNNFLMGCTEIAYAQSCTLRVNCETSVEPLTII